MGSIVNRVDSIANRSSFLFHDIHVPPPTPEGPNIREGLLAVICGYYYIIEAYILVCISVTCTRFQRLALLSYKTVFSKQKERKVRFY